MRALVFDFGNVIAFFNHRLTTERLAAFTDLPPDELHARLFGGQLETDYETGRIGTAEFLHCAREAAQLRCSEEVLAAAWADVFWPNKEVIALLPRLQGQFRLVLGSNTNELHANHFRRQFADALGRFDALVLSHEVGVRKPTAEFFAHCQRQADCRPQECLFIDDLAANVAGARACGWQGIVYTGFQDLQRQLAGLLPALKLAPEAS